MLTYCQFDPEEQTSKKFKSKYKTFHARKCIRKCCLQNGGHFVQGEILGGGGGGGGGGGSCIAMTSAHDDPAHWHLYVLKIFNAVTYYHDYSELSVADEFN